MLQDSGHEVKKILWGILLLNVLVAVTKIIIGGIIQSASITADGFHSLTDGISNVVGLIGIGFATKPIDSDHPYGHKKYEFLTSLCIGAILLIIAAQIGLKGVQRLIEPVIPEFGAGTILILLLTLGVNVLVYRYENKKGKELNSYILISDSLHTKSDIYVSLGVLLTLIGIKLGVPPMIDSITSIVVAGCIVHAACRIIRASSGILLDKAAVDLALIKHIVKSFPQVRDVHKIRSRGSEPDLFVDMHIIIDSAMSTEDAHELVHKIEAKLKAEINSHIQVLIHTEPYKKLPH